MHGPEMPDPRACLGANENAIMSRERQRIVRGLMLVAGIALAVHVAKQANILLAVTAVGVIAGHFALRRLGQLGHGALGWLVPAATLFGLATATWAGVAFVLGQMGGDGVPVTFVMSTGGEEATSGPIFVSGATAAAAITLVYAALLGGERNVRRRHRSSKSRSAAVPSDVDTI